jgi:glycosyltransferase involved in cell wall biosynthesis
MNMNTVAILRAYPKDGALAKIIQALSREHKVQCLIWDRQHDYEPIVVNDNVSYIRCRIRAGFYNVSTLLKLFLFEIWLFTHLLFARIDCIHAIDLDTGFVGMCLAKLRGKPFVYQCLDPYYTILPQGWPSFLAGMAKRLENFVIGQADLFVITDLLRMPQHEGASPKQVVELANVPLLDVSRFTRTPGDCFVVGYIGSLAEGRNLETLIDAIGELKDSRVKLFIGGFGPLADRIAAACGEYANVTYTGWVTFERLFELENTFDLFVYVTDRDNADDLWVSPNKLFESMAFGRPIIVGEGTLSARRVAAMGNGVAVPYRCKEELKQAILLFKDDPQLVLDMGAKGKAEFERKWRPEIMEKRLLESYARLGTDQEKSQS